MSNNNKIRLALVDDHQIIIDGLSSLLLQDETFEIIATANSGEEMLKHLNQNDIDVLLTDVVMENMNGQQLSKHVRQHYPKVKIIALSMSGVGATVEEMINDADISGYLLKQTHKHELIEAITKVFNGGQYFQPKILEELEKQSNLKQQTQEAHLTNREIEIIKLLEKDLSNKQIAEQLFISIRTVETHRKNILQKTGTNNLLTLLKWCYEHKIIFRS